MITLLLALLVSPSYAEMSVEQVVKEFKEPGHIPQGIKPRKYHKLEDVLPSAQREKMQLEYQLMSEDPEPTPSPSPDQTPEKTSRWKILNEAYAGGKKKPDEPEPVVTPTAQPTASVPPSLPQSVDFRKYDTPIRNQWDGTCTAHGLIASMENILNRVNPSQTVLSTRYFWSQYQKYSAFTAISTASRNKQVLDKYWPQNSPQPKVANVSQYAQYSMKGSTYLDDEVDSAVKALAAGKPVYIAMAVPSDMAACRATIRPTTRVTDGGHALSVVGYVLSQQISGGGYFILKNSWGTECGDKGYQYLPFGICDREDIYCTFWSVDGITG